MKMKQPEIGERKCGTCTECCTVIAVDSIGKKEHEKCEHQGAGCRIYDERPKECADFRCPWLEGAGDFSARPDRVGALLLPGRGDRSKDSVRVFSSREEPWKRSKHVRKMIDWAIHSGGAAYISTPGKRRVISANPDLAEEALRIPGVKHVPLYETADGIKIEVNHEPKPKRRGPELLVLPGPDGEKRTPGGIIIP